MRYICPECGSEIPEDHNFCYSCGRKKDNTIRMDESGRFIQPEKNECASCGTEMLPDDRYCPNCGEPVSRPQKVVFRPKLTKKGWIGIILAFVPGALGFIPGFFSIFGLGHLFFKKWSRGALFLVLSAVMLYVRSGWMEASLITSIIFVTLSVFIFLLQGMEVLVLAFMPTKKDE